MSHKKAFYTVYGMKVKIIDKKKPLKKSGCFTQN